MMLTARSRRHETVVLKTPATQRLHADDLQLTATRP